MKAFLIIAISLSFVLNTFSQEKSSFTDPRDGKVYKTVKIGNQTWMAENLAATKLNDGTRLSNVTNTDAWQNCNPHYVFEPRYELIQETAAYCWYKNDAATYGNTYGALYNGYAVNTGKLCPKGWHIPSKEEWKFLVDYLGGFSVAGGKLKSTMKWNSPNLGASNSVGFNALPSGTRSYGSNDFSNIGKSCIWWSDDTFGTLNRSALFVEYNSAACYYGIKDGFLGAGAGLSVRCIKD